MDARYGTSTPKGEPKKISLEDTIENLPDDEVLRQLLLQTVYLKEQQIAQNIKLNSIKGHLLFYTIILVLSIAIGAMTLL